MDYVNQTEIAEYLARASGIDVTVARRQVAHIMDYIRMALLAGDGVRIRRIGRFYVSLVPARNGFNPKTGESCMISAGRRLRFVPSTHLFGGAKPRVSP